MLIIFAVALAVRLGYFAVYEHEPVSDESEYLALGSGLAETGTFALEGTPTAFRPVGYPLLIAAAQAVTGKAISATRVLQALLDALTAALLFVLANNAGRRNATTVGFLWALFPPAILYSQLLLSESFAAFLLVVMLVLLLPIAGLRRSSRAFAAGAVSGLLVLVKPWTILFALAVVLYLRSKSLDSWKPSALFAAGVMLTILPWMARNLLTVGTFSLSTNTGINLYVGNNPSSTGAYGIITSEPLLEVARDEVRLSERAYALAVEHISENPIRFLSMMPVKIAQTFRTEGDALVWAFHPDPRSKGSRFAEKYRSIPLAATATVNAGYCAVLLTGILGFLASRRTEFTALALILAAVLLGIHAVFFGGSRFHFLLMPVLAVSSADVLFHLPGAWKELDISRKVVGAVAAALLVLLWTIELVYVF